MDVSARGFCTCKRDAPGKPHLHPPANAQWHYLCDKPVLPPPLPDEVRIRVLRMVAEGAALTADALADDPDDAEAERIAEVYADAAAELDRIEAEDARDD